ncbi:MAG: ribosome recycling factor [Deltaproteobacteria bacterium HGW-Deltaproteobacteria-17]|jgi:ribosome recycling factor|nr:MAG: ribosome recycling factor [Deltaproteobacteria bacterium HGW-Deltaproteobacteria-17]
MVNDVLEELHDSMDKVIDAFRKELAKVRTGRASLAVLEGIKVDYYGTPTPLNQVANLQVADARLITIKPWEKNMLSAIEKAVIAANIGITPANDGEIIRLPVPPLTEERRKEIVKGIRSDSEEYKVRVRNLRRDANDLLKNLKKDGDISEDDQNRGLTKVQEMTDQFVKKIDECVTDKEKEILSF